MIGLFVIILMLSTLYLGLGYALWKEYGCYYFNTVSLPQYRAWALSVLFLWPLVLFCGVCLNYYKVINTTWKGEDRQ